MLIGDQSPILMDTIMNELLCRRSRRVLGRLILQTVGVFCFE